METNGVLIINSNELKNLECSKNEPPLSNEPVFENVYHKIVEKNENENGFTIWYLLSILLKKFIKKTKFVFKYMMLHYADLQHTKKTIILI